MRFLVDEQLPPALVDHLRKAGHQADHVFAIGLSEDAEIWAYALRRKAVIVTKDQDFAALAQRAPLGPPVVWIRLGNTTNRTLWHAFQPLLSELLEALASGERLIEIS